MEQSARIVDFAMFRPALVDALGRNDMPEGRRPDFVPMLKFKTLVLGSIYGLSLQAIDCLLSARLSQVRFYWGEPCDTVPDANRWRDFPKR